MERADRDRQLIEKYRIETIRHAANVAFNKVNEAISCAQSHPEQAAEALSDVQGCVDLIVGCDAATNLVKVPKLVISQPDLLHVSVYDGKYTVIQAADGRLRALRHGEEWRDCVGDGLILALAQEIETLREATTIAQLENERERRWRDER